MREPGYYWVKLDGEWIIAECDGDDQWGHPFPSNYIADDSDFEEIDERRILPPIENIEHQPSNKG